MLLKGRNTDRAKSDYKKKGGGGQGGGGQRETLGRKEQKFLPNANSGIISQAKFHSS